MSSVFTQGSLMNLLDLPYLQLDKEWWSSLTYKNLQYNGKMFYTSGDLAINSFIGAGCVYMNTNLAEKYGVDENALYKKVYDGTWTMDELYSITKDMDLDLNNDGKMDCVNDFYGLVLEANTLTSNLLLTSCGVHLCDTDPDTGKLTVNLGTQNVVSIIDKLASEFQLIDNAGDNTNLFDKTSSSTSRSSRYTMSSRRSAASVTWRATMSSTRCRNTALSRKATSPSSTRG